jgi:16S rRNA (cytosine1402-N4)-methyltransferase
MPDEVLELLNLSEGGSVADLTLGAGGHAELVLQATAPDGMLIGFDRDRDELAATEQRLVQFANRMKLIGGNFATAPTLLREMGATRLDGVMMDLGVSSMQLDDASRGFSFREDGPLDMRMDPRRGKPASDLIRRLPEEELSRIIFEYGEETRARAIAQKIVEVRRRTKLTRTLELAELVRSVARGHGRIHPATRTFQALRMAVNGELDAVESVLPRIVELLDDGGRLVVISFHSLEDRIVKRFMRTEEKEGRGAVITRKPLLASKEEQGRNRRSRSAKLRCLERRAVA